MKSTCSVGLLGACLAMSAPASAAVPPEVRPPTATPDSPYRSAFADYRAYREEPIADWRTLNDEVAQAGGHVEIMRRANPGAAKPQANNLSAEPVKSAPTRGTDAHRH